MQELGVDGVDPIRDRRPDLETAHLVLSRRPAQEIVRTCIDHGHRVIHPYISMTDEAFMRIARDHDLAVNVWTGFDETDENNEAMIALEVDGVITGTPERALRCRANKTG